MTVSATGGRSRNLILAAMIFAVSMTFIDQTIVSIAAPQIQHELGLSSTGVQWAINAYLLSLAALFAFGGRLADTVGHRKMVTLGVVVFAGASAMCGLTPKGSFAEAWIVTFRVIQGAGGAIMFPAALAIVVQTFALRERGRALAIFFGIAGGLTAVGPVLGGYLTEWTWRAIFWVNIPVALIALILIAVSRPVTDHRPARMDYRGLVLIASGVALSVFGFQQSAIWGWSNPATGASPPEPRSWCCSTSSRPVPRRRSCRCASSASGHSWWRTSSSASPTWCSYPSSSSPASTPRSRSESLHPSPAFCFCTFSSDS
jgi:MFS family permease